MLHGDGDTELGYVLHSRLAHGEHSVGLVQYHQPIESTGAF